MAHCVDAAVHGVQPPTRQPVLNGAPAQPALEQLPPGNEPVLALR
jgi:hypothetical protein